MNIEDTLLTTLFKIIDERLGRGIDEFDVDDIETDAMADPALRNEPHAVLRLALKPLLTRELRELLEKVFRNDPEAKRVLILKLSKGLFPTAVRNFIIGTLAKGLKYQYDGPREVLQETLTLSNATLRHEYAKVLEKTYQYAMEQIANPEYRPRTPTLQPVLNKKSRQKKNQD